MNYVLTQHDMLSKQPALQKLPEHQVVMTSLVYYYIMEGQHNNLFQLLNNTQNVEL